MSKNEQLSSDSMNALRARFEAQSRKAQAYYAVMHQVRSAVGSDDAASAWMEAPQAALGGKTPAELINAGRENDVLNLLELKGSENSA
ncbi:MbcA/ParS/Xre antitoxin family protein [Paucimonas lemoignei]|nr:MbcA/ParS/Xre antitoxin family protein [Paucimonas lemoignei]